MDPLTLTEWTRRGSAVVPVLGMLTVVSCLMMRRIRVDTHRRGAQVVDGRSAQRRAQRLRWRYAPPPLTLAGVAIPARDETKHFKLIGATGSGKSTAIASLMQGALQRGDRAVIADPDGGYLAHFYQRRRG